MKAAILFELLKGCEYWNDEKLKKQIKNGESHEFDGCRYGLKQRCAKKPLPIRKPWRVISWNFDLGESLSKKCNGNHSHGPCAGRETKDTQLYTSLIVNVILRRFAARARCSRHHGVNLASPCIFRGFVEKKELRGGRSSTSTSPSTLRTNCSFDSASHRGEQGECWLHIALGLPVERWWSCTPPGSGKSGPTVEGWWSCTSPGSGKSGVIGSFLWWCCCIFLCLAGSRSCTSSRWGMTSSTRKSTFWELMTALTKDFDVQPGSNVVGVDQTVGDVYRYFHERHGQARMRAESASLTRRVRRDSQHSEMHTGSKPTALRKQGCAPWSTAS